MKKTLSLLLAALIFALLLSGCGSSDKLTLNVYNWGEYISDGADGSLDVNKAFEEDTSIKVIYSN